MHYSQLSGAEILQNLRGPLVRSRLDLGSLLGVCRNGPKGFGAHLYEVCRVFGPQEAADNLSGRSLGIMSSDSGTWAIPELLYSMYIAETVLDRDIEALKDPSTNVMRTLRFYVENY